jgi:hypothetical protein
MLIASGPRCWPRRRLGDGADLQVADLSSPLHAMTGAFTAAGFRMTVISEPEPAPAARELFPDQLAATPQFLAFLFFVLQAG